MRRTTLLVMVLSLLVAASMITSCSAGSPAPARAVEDGSSFAVTESEPAAPAAAPEMPLSRDSVPRAPAQAEGQARMIIRTGELVGRFVAVEDAVGQVEALVTGTGGYVVSSNLWRGGEYLNANMTVRVPAESFDAIMASLVQLAEKVERTSTSGEDVTEEYFDIEARLRALRATEEQLLLLLEDVRERMQDAEDILAVYRELQNVQSQIEQYQGRQQYLDRMVSMSTINVQLLAVEAEAPVISGEWQPMSTLRSALRALTNTGRFILDALIWFIFYLAPLLALILIPIGLILLAVRALVRRRKRNTTSAD
mgnify:FL=1